MSANISPLAQTFKVTDDLQQGCLVTSVDLFFAYNLAGDTSPVEVQIVETLNGYPTDNILKNAKSVMYSNEITSSTTGLVSTKFKFPNFVRLEPNTEYAVKVISNSLKYKLWTAVMGEKRIDNQAVMITQQPAVGSLFKSQNNSTWTPEQLQDLTFRLNRAKFDTSKIGNVTLGESPTSDYTILPPNPFKITNGSTTVKVHHVNHGMVATMMVTYSGSVDTQFNNTFTVVKVIDSDHYTITAASQTATNFVGGNVVTTEKVIKFDTVRVYGIESGRDFNTKLSARFASADTIDAADTTLIAGEMVDMTVSKFVHSSLNKNQKLAGSNSFTFKAELSSVNDAVSPIIDMNGLIVQLLGNKINTPSAASDVDYTIDAETIVTGASNVSFTAATNTITIPSTTDYTKIKRGAWIKISDAGGANDNKTGYITKIDTTANTLTVANITLVDASTRSAIIYQYTSFISEIANNGTAESKTITKQVIMDKKCTGFRVMVSLNVHTDAEIEMYYRAGLKTSETKLSDAIWTKSLITYKKSVTESEFTDYEYNITGLDKFDEFQFKFVMLSSNSAVTPKIKNLRIVAHA